MPEKRRKTENATNPAQHQRGEKLFLRRIGCQKKILTWRCHLRLKCLYSRTHMGNVGQTLFSGTVTSVKYNHCRKRARTVRPIYFS